MCQADYLKSLIPDLTPFEVFDYYDGPTFYSVRDGAGQLFLVYWIGWDEECRSWLYLPIGHDRYCALKSGSVSIASVLSDPEEGVAFLVKDYGDHFAVEEINATGIATSWLPSPTDTLSVDSAR